MACTINETGPIQSLSNPKSNESVANARGDALPMRLRRKRDDHGGGSGRAAAATAATHTCAGPLRPHMHTPHTPQRRGWRGPRGDAPHVIGCEGAESRKEGLIATTCRPLHVPR